MIKTLGLLDVPDDVVAPVVDDVQILLFVIHVEFDL
jgi:hypothetical protein